MRRIAARRWVAKSQRRIAHQDARSAAQCGAQLGSERAARDVLEAQGRQRSPSGHEASEGGSGKRVGVKTGERERERRGEEEREREIEREWQKEWGWRSVGAKRPRADLNRDRWIQSPEC